MGDTDSLTSSESSGIAWRTEQQQKRRFAPALNKPGKARQTREAVRSSLATINTMRTPPMAEPLDYEDFINRHRTVLENDPQRDILLFPRDDITEVIYDQADRTAVPSVSHESVRNAKWLLSQLALRNYTSQHRVLGFNYAKFGGDYVQLAENSVCDELTDLNYELDALEEAAEDAAADLATPTVPSDGQIIKEGQLLQVSEQSGPVSFNKVFKKRYCILRKPTPGIGKASIELEVFKDSRGGTLLSHIPVERIAKGTRKGFAVYLLTCIWRLIIDILPSGGSSGANNNNGLPSPVSSKPMIQPLITLAADTDNDCEAWFGIMYRILNAQSTNNPIASTTSAGMDDTVSTGSGGGGSSSGGGGDTESIGGGSSCEDGGGGGGRRGGGGKGLAPPKITRKDLFQLYPELEQQTSQNADKCNNSFLMAPVEQQESLTSLSGCGSGADKGVKFLMELKAMALKLPVIRQNGEVYEQIEPFYLRFYLYDAKAGIRISEEFHCAPTSNPSPPPPPPSMSHPPASPQTSVASSSSNGNNRKESTSAVGDCRKWVPDLHGLDASWLMHPQRKALFNVSNPHADVYLVIRVERTLQSSTLEAYVKPDARLTAKQEKACRPAYVKLRPYNAAFGWTAKPVFQDLLGNCSGLTGGGSGGGGGGGVHQLKGGDGGGGHNLLGGGLPIYRCDPGKSTDTELAKFLSDLGRPERAGKLQTFPNASISVHLDLSVKPDELQNRVDPSLLPIKPLSQPSLNCSSSSADNATATTSRPIYEIANLAANCEASTSSGDHHSNNNENNSHGPPSLSNVFGSISNNSISSSTAPGGEALLSTTTTGGEVLSSSGNTNNNLSSLTVGGGSHHSASAASSTASLKSTSAHSSSRSITSTAGNNAHNAHSNSALALDKNDYRFRRQRPNHRFVNLLYCYPIQLKFDSQKVFSKARNIVCWVQFKSSDECGVQPLKAIHTRCRPSDITSASSASSPYTTQVSMTVTHHDLCPTFSGEEIKMQLPTALTERDHLLFTFAHISVKDASSTKESKGDSQQHLESPCGYAWFPLLKSDARLAMEADEQEVALPVAANLPDAYLSSKPLGLGKGNTGPEIKWLENGRPLFRLKFLIKSSVFTTETRLQAFFNSCQRLGNLGVLSDVNSSTSTNHHHHKSNNSNSNNKSQSSNGKTGLHQFQTHQMTSADQQHETKEDTLIRTTKALLQINPHRLIPYLPVVVDQLIKLIATAPIEEVALTALKSLVGIVDTTISYGQEPALRSFIRLQFGNGDERIGAAAAKTTGGQQSSVKTGQNGDHQNLRSNGTSSATAEASVGDDIGAGDGGVHGPLCKLLPLLMRPAHADPSTTAAFLRQSWFFLEVMVKSMGQQLLRMERHKVSRRERYASEFQYRVTTLIQSIVPLIVSRHRDLPVETRNANTALAFFIRSSLSLMDRGFIYQMIHFYVDKLDRSDSKTLRHYKLDLLSILSEHEHWLPLSLPILAGEQGILKKPSDDISNIGQLSIIALRFQSPSSTVTVPESGPVKSSSSGLIQRLISTFTGANGMSGRDAIDGLQDSQDIALAEDLRLTKGYCERHFLVGLLLQELAASLREPKEIRKRTITIFRNLLAKHSVDPRNMDKTIYGRIATLYCPFLLIVLDQISELESALRGAAAQPPGYIRVAGSPLGGGGLAASAPGTGGRHQHQPPPPPSPSRDGSSIRKSNEDNDGGYASISGLSAAHYHQSLKATTTADTHSGRSSPSCSLLAADHHRKSTDGLSRISGKESLSGSVATLTSSPPFSCQPPHPSNNPHNQNGPPTVNHTSTLTERLGIDEARDLLISVVFLLRHAPDEIMALLWRQATITKLRDFLRLLEMALDLFQYQGKKVTMKKTSGKLRASRRTINLSTKPSSVSAGAGSRLGLGSRQGSTAFSCTSGHPSSCNAAANLDLLPLTLQSGEVIGGDGRLVLLTTNGSASWRDDPAPFSVLQEAHLSQEVGLTLIDTLLAFVRFNKDRLEVDMDENREVLKLALKLQLSLLKPSSSLHLRLHALHALSTFVTNFTSMFYSSSNTALSPSQRLRMTTNHSSSGSSGVNDLLAPVAETLLAQLASLLPEVQRSAAALLQCLLRGSYEAGGRSGGLGRLGAQLGVALAHLLGGGNSGAGRPLSDSPSFHRGLSYLEGLGNEKKPTHFNRLLHDLVSQLRGVLRATAALAEAERDPHRLAELHLQLADSYRGSSELRQAWLEALSRLHVNAPVPSFTEAAIANLYIAAMIKRELAAKQSTSLINETHRAVANSSSSCGGGYVTEADWALFSSLSENIEQEESKAFNCDTAGYSEDDLCARVEKAVDLLMRAERYECLGPIYRIILSVYERKADHQALSDAYCRLNDAYSRALTLKTINRRSLATYFRVIFYGENHFPDDSGVEWVYKEPGHTSLAEATEKIRERCLLALGIQKLEFLTEDQQPDGKTPAPNKAQVLITHIDPKSDIPGPALSAHDGNSSSASAMFGEKDGDFERNTNVRTFGYETRLCEPGGKLSDVTKVGKRRVYLTTHECFPHVLNRLQVVSRREETLNPLSVAIEELDAKAGQLEKTLKAVPRDIKRLQLQLQGAVQTTVNAGALAYAEAFTAKDQLERYGELELIKLKLSFKRLLATCARALAANAELIGPDQIEYHKMLLNGFTNMITKLNLIFKEELLESAQISAAAASAGDPKSGGGQDHQHNNGGMVNGGHPPNGSKGKQQPQQQHSPSPTPKRSSHIFDAISGM